MCTITRLKAADRRGTRIAVELDGEEWAEVSTNVIVEHGLRRGDALDAAARQALLDDDAFARSRRAAAILLRTRPRAEAELRRLLGQRGFDPPTIERTVEHLRSVDELDDARFARTWVHHQFKTKSIGPLKVREQLRRLGVADDAIAQALADEPAARGDAQTGAIRRVIARRLATLRPDDPRRRDKIRSALLRAGFDADAFRPLLDDALADASAEPE